MEISISGKCIGNSCVHSISFISYIHSCIYSLYLTSRDLKILFGFPFCSSILEMVYSLKINIIKSVLEILCRFFCLWTFSVHIKWINYLPNIFHCDQTSLNLCDPWLMCMELSSREEWEMVRKNMKQVGKVKDANKTIRGFLDAYDEHVIKPDRISARSRYFGATRDTHALYWGVGRLQIVKSMEKLGQRLRTHQRQRHWRKYGSQAIECHILSLWRYRFIINSLDLCKWLHAISFWDLVPWLSL